MAGSFNPSSGAAHDPNAPAQTNWFALSSLTTLFFMWGFITCLNDILIPYLKGAFDLTYTQAMLVQFCFFGAYFIVSLPAGNLVAKIGYKNGIVSGLAVACLGCALFYPAAQMQEYALFLGALFVLAAGITLLQVAANPCVSMQGPPRTASSRLTLTQAFNSLGTTVAPFFGAWLLFAGGVEHEVVDASAVKVPYLILAAALLALALVFFLIRLPTATSSTATDSTDSPASFSDAWQYRHLRLGAFAIFAYVGAEVAIGSFLVNFLNQPHVAGIEEAEAAEYIAYYWGGAMVGRFIGAVVMQRVAAGKVLAFNSAAAIILVILAISMSGELAMWAILAVGLFNSIMFPTIFTLGLQNLGKATSQGSGILCLAIVGGAIVPLGQGVLADGVNLSVSFLLPVVCYIYIAFFGLSGSKPQAPQQTSGKERDNLESPNMAGAN